jgi:hypothetical protein
MSSKEKYFRLTNFTVYRESNSFNFSDSVKQKTNVQKYNVRYHNFTKITFQSRQSEPFGVNLEGPTGPSMKREG